MTIFLTASSFYSIFTQVPKFFNSSFAGRQVHMYICIYIYIYIYIYIVPGNCEKGDYILITMWEFLFFIIKLFNPDVVFRSF